MPHNKDFGLDKFEHYGTLTYVDDEGKIHEEKVESVKGIMAEYMMTYTKQL